MADRTSVEHRIAAVVPTWNEAAAIGEVVRALQSAGACCVLVVDSGSTDRTREAALRAGAEVIDEPRPGYGRACLTGAEKAADHELIAFLDGDGSCDPADLSLMATAACPETDLVLGRRQRCEAGALAWHARLGNNLVATLLRRRTGRPIHDLPPFKLIRAEALAALNLDETGYGWTVQLVGRAMSHRGLHSVEVPVAFRTRRGGRSKVSGRLVPSVRAGRAMLMQALRASGRRGLLVLMAKAPGGDTKTRLQAGLGTNETMSFWEACLRDAGARLRRAAREAGLYAVAMTPSAADAADVRRLTGLPALAQRRPGLGQALLEVSELGAPLTIAVSADAPSLPESRLMEAVDALHRHAAVLGPGEDGGYYLVGLRHAFPRRRRERAFLEAPMGTTTVLAQTQEALGDVHLLASWPDVDSVIELRRLAQELAADPRPAPAVAAWFSRRQTGAEEGV